MDFYGLSIGDTPLYQVMELGDRLKSKRGRPIVWIKDESQNSASHTFKDRLAMYELQRNKGLDNVTFLGITYGNCGEAFGKLCRQYEISTGKQRRFASVVKKDLDKKTKKRLRSYGQAIELDLGRHLTSAAMLSEASKIMMLGSNAGTIIPVGGIDYNGSGYKAVSRELYDAGVRKNWRIFVPVGEGDFATNIVYGFEELGEMPVMHGATIPENVFASGFGSGRIADKLFTEHSDFENALRDLCSRYGFPKFCEATSDKINEEYEYLKKLGIKTSFSSAVAFYAAREYAEKTGFEDGENVVWINTGFETEKENTLLGQMSIYAKRIAIALLLALMPLMISDVNKSRMDAIQTAKQDQWEIDYLQNEQQRLSRVPELADMEAYAKFRGSVEKLSNGELVVISDRKVFNDLTYWYFSNDSIVRSMYSNPQSTMRQNVDGFREWKKRRESAKKAGKGYWQFEK
jgi:Pyridoxal-phosphate dependent enzyme